MQAARVAGQCMPRAVGARLVQRDADPRRTAPRRELRRDHARVVDHQHIARMQQPGQLAHQAIRQTVMRHMQETCGIARAGGVLRDPVARQVEVEIGQPHQA